MHIEALAREAWTDAIALSMKGLVALFLPLVLGSFEGVVTLTPALVLRVLAGGIVWGFGLAAVLAALCLAHGVRRGEVTLVREPSLDETFDDEELEALGFEGKAA